MAQAGKKTAPKKKKAKPLATLPNKKAGKPERRILVKKKPSRQGKTPKSRKADRPKKPAIHAKRRQPMKPKRKPAAKTAAAKAARKTRRIPKIPATAATERQLAPIEEKRPLMILPPSQAPAVVLPRPAPSLSMPGQPAPAAQKPLSIMPQPAEGPKAPPHIDASGPSGDGPLAIPLTPALDMLPEWEDRLRLKRAIFEDGLTFFSLGRHCHEFHEASSMLAPSGKNPADNVPGYFIVCLKDRAGRMVGAMDGHMLDDNVMAIGRSAAKGERRRELHILLYSAALSGHQPSYIFYSTKKSALSEGSAALLILLGRGFGFSAVPAQIPDRLLLVRRVRHELDPISSGQEISQALIAAKPALGSQFGEAISEIGKKGIMPLIPLPASPDSREHLHELRDLVSMLGISADNLDAVIEKLRVDYVLGRKDITPEIIS